MTHTKSTDFQQRVSSEWLARALEVLESTHNGFSRRVTPPKRVQFGDGYRFEFVEKSLEQALVLKLARIVTGLKATNLLIDAGYLLEAATIQRGLDELSEDIDFLVFGKLIGQDPKLHTKYLNNFWSDHPASKQSVLRPHIRNYISNVMSNEHGAPARDIVRPMIETYAIYSGFAHASSTSSMELFGGKPARWRLGGVTDDNLQKDHRADLWNQYYRGLLAFAFSARAFDDEPMFRQLVAFAKEFSEASGANYFV